MKKIKHIFLACIMAASTLCSVGCQEIDAMLLKKEDIPDYSAYTDQFDFFGYHSAHDGYYYIDDAKYYVGESFLTTEQYQMYKDAGMTIFYPQSILKIRGEGGAMRDSEESQKYQKPEVLIDDVKTEMGNDQKKREEIAKASGSSVVYNPDELNVEASGSGDQPLIIDTAPKKSSGTIAPPPPPSSGSLPAAGSTAPITSTTTSGSSSDNSIPALF